MACLFPRRSPGRGGRNCPQIVRTLSWSEVAGTYAGSPALEEEDAIVSRIRASHADLVFVAYGAPKQDLWFNRNLERTGARSVWVWAVRLILLPVFRQSAPLGAAHRTWSGYTVLFVNPGVGAGSWHLPQVCMAGFDQDTDRSNTVS